MKTLIRSLLHAFEDTVYLFKQQYTHRQKLTLIQNYMILGSKSLFAHTPKKGVVTSRVCGLRVTAFSHTSIFYLFREIFIHGEYNFLTPEKNPVFFDLGANIGMTTLFLKWNHPGCTVHAFEPDPDTFTILKENIEKNSLTNVQVHNLAIGGTHGSVDFYTNSPSAGSLRMSVGRERAEGKKLTVPMKTLSSFLTMQNVYVKMDTEGSETETIRELSASGKIANIKEMVVEYHHRINSESSHLSDILGPIEEAGFEYELECANKTLTKKEVYQNVMLYCYRK